MIVIFYVKIYYNQTNLPYVIVDWDYKDEFLAKYRLVAYKIYVVSLFSLIWINSLHNIKHWKIYYEYV